MEDVFEYVFLETSLSFSHMKPPTHCATMRKGGGQAARQNVFETTAKLNGWNLKMIQNAYVFRGVKFSAYLQIGEKNVRAKLFPEIFIPQIWKFGPVIDLQQICVSLCQGSIKRLHFWSWKPLKPFTIVPVTFIKVKLYQQFDGDVEFNHGTPWSNVLGGFFSSLLLSGVLTLQGFGHKFSAKNGVTPLKTNTSPEK